MPRYTYIAKDINGINHKGIVDAENERDARNRLKQKDLFVTKINEVRKNSFLNSSFFGKIKSEEIAVLAEQLSVMIDAGLSLPDSLEIISNQQKNKILKRILNEVRSDVENGVNFSDALNKHPKAFSKMFVSLVRAGEMGGIMSNSLRQISEYLDREQQTRQRVKSALAYPKVVLVICFLVVTFILYFIVPRFTTVYASFNIKLPLATIILVESSKIIVKYWWALFICVISLIVLFKLFIKTKVGKEIFDNIKLFSPVFGSLNRKATVSRFIRVLSALHTSGVLLMQSLEVAQEVVDNTIMDGIINNARARVNEGGRLMDSVAGNKVFPTMVVSMISVGEETGSLGGSLEKSSSYLDRDIDTTVKRLIAKIEPAVTVIIGAVVGLVAMAIYLPMFDITKIVH